MIRMRNIGRLVATIRTASRSPMRGCGGTSPSGTNVTASATATGTSTIMNQPMASMRSCAIASRPESSITIGAVSTSTMPIIESRWSQLWMRVRSW